MFYQLPLEINKLILFKLDACSLEQALSVSKYIHTIKNDFFYQTYIINNYDPSDYNLISWDSSVFDNKYICPPKLNIVCWENVHRRLSCRKFCVIRVLDQNKKLSEFDFIINFSDTFNDIVNNCIKLKNINNFVFLISGSINKHNKIKLEFTATNKYVCKRSQIVGTRMSNRTAYYKCIPFGMVCENNTSLFDVEFSCHITICGRPQNNR
jgi:hypothetical protein